MENQLENVIEHDMDTLLSKGVISCLWLAADVGVEKNVETAEGSSVLLKSLQGHERWEYNSGAI